MRCLWVDWSGSRGPVSRVHRNRASNGAQQDEENTMRNELGMLLVTSAFALGMIVAPAARADEAATITVTDGHLVGSHGMSLYLFEPDNRGASTCYEACATAWPPLITKGAPKAGSGAEASMLGTMDRKDGSMQVTYHGWPLYYFVKDKKAGDTVGQGKKGFGGEWYLVEPSGDAKE
jgi:predicted lipoprotein with Yx(FWY)xxD motif